MLIEVSLGEAIDKLTILDIKLEKISDISKSKFIQEERDYLYNILHIYINKYPFFFQTLKKVNLEIWELQDKLRLLNGNDTSYSKFCEEVILLNDSRFLIKNKINKIENSKFQEQKGYTKRIIFFNTLSTDSKIIYPIVRFFSILYDEIYLNKESNFDLFNDDITIKLLNENNNSIVPSDYIIINNENILIKSNHPFLKYVTFSNIFNEIEDKDRTTMIYKKLNLDFLTINKYCTSC